MEEIKKTVHFNDTPLHQSLEEADGNQPEIAIDPSISSLVTKTSDPLVDSVTPVQDNGSPTTRDIPRLFLEAGSSNGRVIRISSVRSKAAPNTENMQLTGAIYLPATTDRQQSCKNKEDPFHDKLSTTSTLSIPSATLECSVQVADKVGERNDDGIGALCGSSSIDQSNVSDNMQDNSVIDVPNDSVCGYASHDINEGSISNISNIIGSSEYDGITMIDLPPPPSYESVCQNVVANQSNESPSIADNLQLPTYNDVVCSGRYLEDAPPDYRGLFTQSVFRMMDLPGSETRRPPDRDQPTPLKRAIAYGLSLVIMFIIIGIVLVLPLAMIIIGVQNLQNCPAQPRIPVFLVSVGVFQLLECCLRAICFAYKKTRSPNNQQQRRYHAKDPFVYFIVVWFVVGSMWVYQNYPTCHTIETNNEYMPVVGDRGLTKNTIRDIITDSARFSNGTFHQQLKTSVGGSLTHSYSNQSTTSIGTTLSTTAADSNTTTTMTGRLINSTSRPSNDAKVACCGKTVYFFTFWLITVYYSIIGLIIFLHIFANLFKIVSRSCCPSR